MSLSFFYNALNGGGAIADITAEDVRTSKVFSPDSLPVWTHLVKMPVDLFNPEPKLFVYNRYDRSGAIGGLEPTRFNVKKAFPARSFNPWTHITGVGSLLFFYDRDSGVGAFAETAPKIIHLVDVKHSVPAADLENTKLGPQMSLLTPIDKVIKIGPETEMDCVTVRSFPAGSFSPWTHVVSSNLHLFFYNKDTGEGSLQRVRRTTPKNAKELIHGGGVEMHTVKDFLKGSLGVWTHVVAAAPYLFFYNRNTRAGKFMRIGSDGLSPVKEFAPGSFSPWTHILAGESLSATGSAGTGSSTNFGTGAEFLQPDSLVIRDDGGSILFYDKEKGIAALSTIHSNVYSSGKVFGAPGAFGDWTSISSTAAVTSPFDSGYRLYRTPDGNGVGYRSSRSALQTEVTIPPSEAVTPEEKQEAVETIWGTWKKFYEEHEDEIKSGRIKAVDLGGVLYASAAAAVVAIFNPLAALPFFVKIGDFSLTDVSEKVGRFYGAAVDDFVDTLKNIQDKSPSDLVKIVAVMKTMTLVSTQLQVVTLLGENGWELTKNVGSMVGGVVEDGLNSIAKAAGDVFDSGLALAESAVDVVTGALDDIGL